MSRPDEFSRALLRGAAPPPVLPEEGELDALGIFRLVRRRIWLIIAITLLVTAAALPFVLALKPVYSAGSRLLIQNPLTTTLSSSAEDRMVRLNLTTEVERLLSRETAIRVIHELGIDKRAEFNPALREASKLSWLRGAVHDLLAGGEEARFAPGDPMDTVIPEYSSALRVDRDGVSDVVRISFASQDPALAAAVPNTLLHVYLAERATYLASEVGRANAWLAQRIDEQTSRVTAAAQAVEKFGEAAGLSSDPRMGTLQAISTLNAQRTDIAQRRAELTATLSDLDAAQSREDKVALTESAALAELSRDLQLRRYDLDRLLKIYGNNHSEVVAAQAKIEDSAAQLDVEINRSVQSLKTKLVMLDREDEALGSQLATALADLSRQDAAEAQRRELERAADAEQTALERLEEQGRTLMAEGKLPVADVEVLSPATVPLAPMGRGRLFYLFAAVVVAGMLGVTTACALEMIDRSVRSHQQLRGIAGIAPSAMVPRVPRRIVRDLAALVRQGEDGMFGDAIRGIGLSMEHASDARMPESLTVTSALPGEGKSFIAAALAFDLAAAGHSVLLVDGDPRHGRIHTLFGAAAVPGLTDYLSGASDLEEIIHHDAESGIDYICRGSERPARQHERDMVAGIIQSAAEKRRILIFDTPPVLATVETAKLASLTERTLLVVRWGRTSRDAVESAAQRLRSDRRDQVLVAINMVNRRRHALYGFKDAELYSRALRRYQLAHV